MRRGDDREAADLKSVARQSEFGITTLLSGEANHVVWKCVSGLPTLRRVKRAALLLAVVIAVLPAPEGALAQGALRASEEQLVNYAYATQLGSGVYNISGRTLQIYRLPFGYTFSQPSGKRPGVRLTMPLTIGFVDFEPRDVIDSGLPENLDTLSFSRTGCRASTSD